LKNVWPETFVDENSLAQSISALRRALEEKPGDNTYIVTLPGRGYQFVSVVQVFAPENPAIVPDAATAASRGPRGLIIRQQTIRTSVILKRAGSRVTPARDWWSKNMTIRRCGQRFLHAPKKRAGDPRTCVGRSSEPFS
jgi:hypothetical protein